MPQILWNIPIFNGIPIHSSGVLFILVFLIGRSLAIRHARRKGIARERAEDLFLWLCVGGLLTARICILLI